METITIKVAEKTAREWEKASPELRANLEKQLDSQIDDLIYRSKLEKLKKTLDELGKEAEANGLTEEILQEILNEDD